MKFKIPLNNNQKDHKDYNQHGINQKPQKYCNLTLYLILTLFQPQKIAIHSLTIIIGLSNQPFFCTTQKIIFNQI
jgi:hypothetical protein